MNVLSLFDGMSCGRIALERAGIPVTNYFASEIDPYAIKVSKANWPDIKHLGDVRDIKIKYNEIGNHTAILTKTKTFVFQGRIDLLIGGSPCQGFSKMGNMLNFDDSRSKLFFEYARLKMECVPKYFLLENVPVKSEWDELIANELNSNKSIVINSRSISPQNRKRAYWTNIPGVQHPESENVKLSSYLNDAKCILRWQNKKAGAVIDFDKAACLVASDRTGLSKIQFVVRNIFFDSNEIKEAFTHLSKCTTRSGRISSISSIRAHGIICNGVYSHGQHIDQMTVAEAESIQGVPRGYTEGVSNSQRYKMIGNGWEVRTITHIFKNIPQ
jgi:DNA-cytosine methyltransferase